MKKGSLGKIKSFLKEHENFKIHTSDEKGWTAFHWASYEGNVKVMKFLRERKSSLMWTTFRNESPLHLASGNKKITAVDYLLEEGSSLTALNWDGETALFYAVSSGDSKTVQLLIDKGAFLDEKDQEGKTSLQKSVSLGLLEVAACLLKAGAKVNETDFDGVNALEISYTTENRDMAKLLLIYDATMSKALLKEYRNPSEELENPVMEIVRAWSGESVSLEEREKKEVSLARRWIFEQWKNLYVSAAMQQALNAHLKKMKRLEKKYKNLYKATTVGFFEEESQKLFDYGYSDSESDSY